MKSQSLRRLLTLVNVGLVLAVGGFAAWYFVKVRPAAADSGKRVSWVKKAYDDHQVDTGNAHKVTHWQVDENDFEHIIRRDLMDTKRPTAPGVWPYVGPVPPKVERVVAEVKPKEEAPKGLNALGKLASVIAGGPHVRGTISIRFNSTPPRIGHFAVGGVEPIEEKPTVMGKDADRVEEGPPKRRAGKYLTGIEWIGFEGDDPVYRISYDEVTDPDKPAVAKDERMVLAQTMLSEKSTPALEFPPGTPGATALRPAGTGAPTASTGLVPSRDQVRVTPVKTPDGRYRVEFDDAAYSYLRNADLNAEILRDVKSEDVRDEKGGVRVTGLDSNNVLSKFDVARGDILRSINGVRVHNRAQAIEVVKKIPPDTASVAVVIERDGVERTYDIDPRDPAVRAAAGKVRFDGKK